MVDEQAVLHDDGTIEFHDVLHEEPPVTWASVDEFAATYDAEQIEDAHDPDHELGAATKFMMALAHEGPDWAVDFFRQLVVRVDSSSLGILGAGPLEDLVRHDSQDPGRIEAVEIAARQLPEFQKTLSNVWLGEDLPQAFRSRLSVLGARDFVAEHEMNGDEIATYTEFRDSKGWDWG